MTSADDESATSIADTIRDFAVRVSLGNTKAAPDRLRRVADGLHKLADRAEAAEADARRYRWLRDRPDGWRVMKFDGFGLDLDHVIDDAIDAELAKEGK